MERKEKQTAQALFDFIAASPTAMHAAEAARQALLEAGFTELRETELWGLVPGGRYFVRRGMSSLTAFKLPEKPPRAFSIVAPHGDSPCFKVKASPEMSVATHYTKLNTEVYGGLILSRWIDRPLSVAGRLVVKTETGVRAVLTDIPRDLLMIPGLAIHLDREANQGRKLDSQKDTLPLLGGEGADLLALAAEAAGVRKEDVLAHDLYLYNRQRGTLFGAEEEFLAAPRLDDLECVFSALQAFLPAENAENCLVFTVFDNEEIGSMTRQGADSTFLYDVLDRIWRGARKTSCYSAGLDEETFRQTLQGSFLLSADNAHALHPNYPEKADPTNPCVLGGGIVLKHGTRYATDGVTAGVFRAICDRAGVPVQEFYNHSAIPGGSTLGNISGSHVSVPTVDIGLAQLSMHSPYESAGTADLDAMIRGMRAFYECDFEWKSDVVCEIR